MRSEPSQVGSSKGGRARNRPVASREVVRTARLRRVALEKLEARTLMATRRCRRRSSTRRPPALPGNPVDVSNNGGNSAEGNDRANGGTRARRRSPSTRTTRSTWWRPGSTTDPSLPAPTQAFVEAAYSTDGGQTWTRPARGEPDPARPDDEQPDQELPPGHQPHRRVRPQRRTSTSSTRIATAATPPASLALTKYDFTGGTPSLVFVNNPIYQWNGSDLAVSPTLAVDDNAATLHRHRLEGADAGPDRPERRQRLRRLGDHRHERQRTGRATSTRTGSSWRSRPTAGRPSAARRRSTPTATTAATGPRTRGRLAGDRDQPGAVAPPGRDEWADRPRGHGHPGGPGDGRLGRLRHRRQRGHRRST